MMDALGTICSLGTRFEKFMKENDIIVSRVALGWAGCGTFVASKLHELFLSSIVQ